MKKPILLPILTILICAVILFALSVGLNGTAAANAQKDHIALMQTLLPDDDDFAVNYDSNPFTVVPYAGDDANIRSVHKSENGFVIETVTYGYAGEITMFVGVNNEGKVTGLVVRDLSETYGLGKEALTNVEFLRQFLNSSGTFEVATAGADAFSGATAEAAESAEGDTVEVDALTGATVTSKAVVRAVNSAVAYVTGADTASAATSWGG